MQNKPAAVGMQLKHRALAGALLVSEVYRTTVHKSKSSRKAATNFLLEATLSNIQIRQVFRTQWGGETISGARGATNVHLTIAGKLQRRSLNPSDKEDHLLRSLERSSSRVLGHLSNEHIL